MIKQTVIRAGMRAVVVTLFMSLGTVSVHAALHDRGGGLIYDDVLDVTWLQDANYAMTSGHDEDGLMNWFDAMQWVTDLSYYDGIRSVIYDDWRLPSVSPVDGTSFDYAWDFAGRTDTGYNITSTASEMSYMYYINLGNVSAYTSGGQDNPVWGPPNSGPFGNLQRGNYWSGTKYALLIPAEF